MGATGLLTLDLLEREGVLAPGGFVGVDLDPARIDGFRQRRPDLKWVAGNLYERLDAPELANVGVLNLDEYGEVGNRSAPVDFPLDPRTGQAWAGDFGEFALFWNQDLDAVVRRRQERGQALRRHADMVCGAFGAACRRELTSEMLLPKAARRKSMPVLSASSGHSRFIAVRFAGTAWPICGCFAVGRRRTGIYHRRRTVS